MDLKKQQQQKQHNICLLAKTIDHKFITKKYHPQQAGFQTNPCI